MAEIRGIDSPGINMHVEGLEELQQQLDDIGKLPKRSLTAAAKAGMKPILAQARSNASPYKKSGMMQKGIKSLTETPNKRNKAVYRINWWGKYSDFYKKKINNPGIYGGKKNPAYYPQSIEWGYPMKKRKMPGKYFVRSAIEQHQEASSQIIIDTLMSEIDKLL